MHYRKKNLNFSTVLNAIFLFLSIFQILLVIIMNFYFYKVGISSDTGGDALTARAMWEYKSLNPSNWYGSTESRIFSISTLAAVIYGITQDLIFSMGMVCSVATIGIVLAYRRLLNILNFNKTAQHVAILLMLTLTGGIYYSQFLYLFMASYSLHVIALFLVAGDYILLVKFSDKLRVSYFINVLFVFLLTLSGMRALLVVSAPLFLTECVRWGIYFFENRKLPMGHYYRTLAYSISMVVIPFFATFFPYSVGIGLGRNIRNAPKKFLNHVLPAILDCLNLSTDNLVYCFCVLCFILITLSVIIVVIRNKCENEKIFMTVCFLGISVLLTAFMNTFTTVEVTGRYYFVIYFVISICCAYYCQNYLDKKRIYVIASIIIMFVNINFANNYLPIMRSYNDMTETKEILQWLENNDYRNGYAQFNDANALTLHSNGEIQISAVDKLEKLNMCKWLSDISWYVPYVDYEADTAYIIRKSENHLFSPQLSLHDDITLSYETENYYLYTSPHNYTTLEG